MGKKKITIEDIFDDDDFGLLDSKPKNSNVKTEEDRLIDSFEEINAFIDKHNREPGTESMSEYSLTAKLKNFRNSEDQKIVLKPFDRHNLLGHVEIDSPSLDEILDDDSLGLLDSDNELSIFDFKHTPKPSDRAESDFIAHRKPMKEEEFAPYEQMFFKIHQEIKEGKRKIKPFKNAEKNLKKGHYYLLDGLLLFLEEADLVVEEKELKSGSRVRSDGRTRIIFENSTISNMLFRSLGKQLLMNGKLITQSNEDSSNELFINSNTLQEEDVLTGWIYVLKTKSKNPQLSEMKDLYKIGFSTTTVNERIKNSKNEATYLFDDVKIVSTYKCYNRNASKLETLLHKVFAAACLDIDIFNDQGQRINPREWFVVPFDVIEEGIQLILSGNIIDYYYDPESKKMRIRG